MTSTNEDRDYMQENIGIKHGYNESRSISKSYNLNISSVI